MRVETLLLPANGWVPNHPRLPVRIYRAGRARLDARGFEQRFAAHGWPPDWRGGIYAYHHYHSTAHEVLGVARGHARLVLGGPDARTVDVSAGDALLLPAGTGHCCLQADAAFQVVGAYPKDQRWDVMREAPDRDTLARMHALPDPARDPVTGEPF